MTKQPRWDADFPLIRLNGSGARTFLQGQSTADLRNLGNGALQRSCWLTATGRLRALLEIRIDDTGADVLVLAGDAEAVARGFDMVIFPADRVRLSEVTTQRRVQELTPDASTIWIDGDGQLPPALSSSVAVEHDALELWRLQLGFPPGPNEMNGETNPFELGLADLISLDKGCYLGQETMAKLAGKGGVKQQLRCWSSDQPLNSDDQLNIGDQLKAGDARAGLITSTLSTASDLQIGLALVRRQFLAHAHLTGPHGQQLRLQQPQWFQAPPAVS